ncbi:hypothetical protein AGMMS49965_25530 [Bacteroidia bacterium]|nr:hypothetical protein AGMMS49965_25530 [Bacteroidia bacterium]
MSAPIGSIIAAMITAVFAFISGILIARKKTFVDAITTQRIQYMNKLKDLIAEFCYLAVVLQNEKECSRKVKLSEKLTEKQYKIEILLFPYDYPEWDGIILKLVNQIADPKADPKADILVNIEELMLIIQFNGYIEWEGIKQESKKGILAKENTNAIRKKYRRKYLKQRNENPQKYNSKVVNTGIL